jgi:hypothetical protein
MAAYPSTPNAHTIDEACAFAIRWIRLAEDRATVYGFTSIVAPELSAAVRHLETARLQVRPRPRAVSDDAQLSVDDYPF